MYSKIDKFSTIYTHIKRPQQRNETGQRTEEKMNRKKGHRK